MKAQNNNSIDLSLLKNVKKNNFKKMLRKNLNPFAIIGLVVLIVYSISLIYVLFWGFTTSMKTRSEFVISKFSLPKAFRLSNYVNAFNNLYIEVEGQKVFLLRLIINSLIYAVGHAFISLFSTAICAYCCAKYRNKFTKFIFSLVIVMMIVPMPTSLGASLEFHMKFGIYDNIYALFWTCIGFNTGNFLVCYATFQMIDWAYAESAFIDGASHFRVYFTIFLPLAAVPLTILFVLAFIGHWNNYMTPYLYLPHFPTAAVALYKFQFSTITEISNTPTQMAAAMLVCFPCLILFIVLKDKMVGNLTMGGLKG